MLAHAGVLLVGFLAPLVAGDDDFTRSHAKAALNFHICYTLWFVVTMIAAFVVHAAVGFLAFAVLGVVTVVLQIVAAVRASSGSAHRYPLALSILS